MRLYTSWKVLALGLVLAAPHGFGLAQGTASHRVSISIPTVLRLRLDDGATRDSAALDLAIEVAGETVRIEPDRTRIEVRANAPWALDVRYERAADSGEVPLGVALEGMDLRRIAHGIRLASGAATGGWRALDFRYGLLDSLSDGTYHGTVTYTLTQP
jgi:hypothetical protein